MTIGANMQCRSCGTVKPLAEYYGTGKYKNKQYKDKTCKACRKKERAVGKAPDVDQELYNKFFKHI